MAEIVSSQATLNKLHANWLQQNARNEIRYQEWNNRCVQYHQEYLEWRTRSEEQFSDMRRLMKTLVQRVSALEEAVRERIGFRHK